MNDGASEKFSKTAKKVTTKSTRSSNPGDESDVLANIAAMSEPDRVMAARLHEIINTNAPTLTPRLWYGMPGYARDGKVVCFFQAAGKFKTRYATLGFQHEARLDEGHMWPVAFALTELSIEDEARIGELVKRAVG